MRLVLCARLKKARASDAFDLREALNSSSNAWINGKAKHFACLGKKNQWDRGLEPTLFCPTFAYKEGAKAAGAARWLYPLEKSEFDGEERTEKTAMEEAKDESEEEKASPPRSFVVSFGTGERKDPQQFTPYGKTRLSRLNSADMEEEEEVEITASGETVTVYRAPEPIAEKLKRVPCPILVRSDRLADNLDRGFGTGLRHFVPNENNSLEHLLRHEKSMVDAIVNLFDYIRTSAGANSGVDQITYGAFVLRLIEALLPTEVPQLEAEACADVEWARDSRGQKFMSSDYFVDAMLELADDWCPQTDPASYCSFFRAILRKVKELEGWPWNCLPALTTREKGRRVRNQPGSQTCRESPRVDGIGVDEYGKDGSLASARGESSRQSQAPTPPALPLSGHVSPRVRALTSRSAASARSVDDRRASCDSDGEGRKESLYSNRQVLHNLFHSSHNSKREEDKEDVSPSMWRSQDSPDEVEPFVIATFSPPIAAPAFEPPPLQVNAAGRGRSEMEKKKRRTGKLKRPAKEVEDAKVYESAQKGDVIEELHVSKLKVGVGQFVRDGDVKHPSCVVDKKGASKPKPKGGQRWKSSPRNSNGEDRIGGGGGNGSSNSASLRVHLLKNSTTPSRVHDDVDEGEYNGTASERTVAKKGGGGKEGKRKQKKVQSAGSRRGKVKKGEREGGGKKSLESSMRFDEERLSFAEELTLANPGRGGEVW
eukprot:CAMPEP_0113898234 /NCGR_PEP_ID=MMETSP0780_2-20120614/19239_1 /TAXON_ID=652834 /ORGANISM="Palpitomonas bilix" /LENGTH=711 /DNA_ID=CAMNT_0000890021 /DNA_START=203 /DNA_END=2335 /DNA_ORIENTATION=- /assembly_acc=CAM_ASM_000599